MASYSFYNGIYAKTEDISIPLTDRAMYFGDGIYDAAIGRNGKIFLLDEHLDRLYGNAPKLSIPVGYTREEMTEKLSAAYNKAAEQYGMSVAEVGKAFLVIAAFLFRPRSCRFRKGREHLTLGFNLPNPRGAEILVGEG